jgi:hypothetical protein
MRTILSSLLVSTTALVASPALADEPAATSFATVGSASDGSRVTADLGITLGEDLSIVRSTITGQYLGAAGLGGYVGISGAVASVDGFEEDSGTLEALGNLELGGLYRRALSPELDVGLRLGVVLPTSTDDFDAFGNLLATMVARPTDFVTAHPEVTWLRAAVAPTFQRGALFARADVGVDIAVLDTEEAEYDVIGHANLGVGVRSGRISITGELQNVAAFGEDDDEEFGEGEEMDLSERFIHTAALSLRYHAPNVEPFITVSSPLDEDTRGEFVTVSAGVSAPF